MKLRNRDLGENWQHKYTFKELRIKRSWSHRIQLKHIIKSGQDLRKPFYTCTKAREYQCLQPKHLLPINKREDTEVCNESFTTFYDLCKHFAESHAVYGKSLLNVCLKCEKIYDDSAQLCSTVVKQREDQVDCLGNCYLSFSSLF